MLEQTQKRILLQNIETQVYNLLDFDTTGHDMDHIHRVIYLAQNFAKEEHADEFIVSVIALLHDIDDYKLFGEQNAEELPNARNILSACNIPDIITNHVLSAIKTIGYSKRLRGIEPDMLEGRIVSDADMCDTMGVTGIMRSHAYTLAQGSKFFDKTVWPNSNLSSEDYRAKRHNTPTVTHMFEKLLKLKDLMLTGAGRKEAATRQNIMIEILHHFFQEENVPEWTEYLNNFCKNN